MKIKSVQTVDIKEVGTINLAGVEANSGQISVHIQYLLIIKTLLS